MLHFRNLWNQWTNHRGVSGARATVPQDQRFLQTYNIQVSGWAPHGESALPLIADVFLNRFKEDIIELIYQWSNSVLRWFRYVDDILCVWGGSPSELAQFHTFLNEYHPNLEFTLEVGHARIKFLYLTINLVPEGEELTIEFDIFHKPGYIGITIHGSSFHPLSHKNAAYFTMIHRLRWSGKYGLLLLRIWLINRVKNQHSTKPW